MSDAVILSVGGDTRNLERDISSAVNRLKPVNLSLNTQGFSAPLGRITGQVADFERSMSAATARISAFGINALIFVSVGTALRGLVENAIKVQKELLSIQAITGASSSKIKEFGNTLFEVAKNTGSSFEDVAETAQQFSRQTTDLNQVLKRTQDALILTRLTGLDTAKAIQALTAVTATFNKEGLDTTTVLNKLIAVDSGFAASAKDLANGLSRSSAAARDAKVSFDQLAALITAVQAISQRGGSVIGNSLKSIFTRLQRPDTLEDLEKLGIGVRDLQGNTVGAVQILSSLAQRYDTLTDAQRAYTAELVGGVYNVNVLKTALGDLSSKNSIYSQALYQSVNASDAAIKRNELLNQSYATLGNTASVNFTKLTSSVGELTLGPAIKTVLSSFNEVSDASATNVGTDIGAGILKGIGNYINGPGIVLLGALALKFLSRFASYALGAAKNVLEIGTVVEAQSSALQRQSGVYEKLITSGSSRLSQEKAILGVMEKQASLKGSVGGFGSGTLQSGGFYKSISNAQDARLHRENLENELANFEQQKAGIQENGLALRVAQANARISTEEAASSSNSAVRRVRSIDPSILRAAQPEIFQAASSLIRINNQITDGKGDKEVLANLLAKTQQKIKILNENNAGDVREGELVITLAKVIQNRINTNLENIEADKALKNNSVALGQSTKKINEIVTDLAALSRSQGSSNASLLNVARPGLNSIFAGADEGFLASLFGGNAKTQAANLLNEKLNLGLKTGRGVFGRSNGRIDESSALSNLSPEEQTGLNSINNLRSSRRLSALFGASILEPIAGGFAQQGASGNPQAERAISGVSSSIGTGLSLAAFGGAPGAVVGAAIGLFGSLNAVLSNLSPNFEDLDKITRDYAETQKQQLELAGQFVEGQTNLIESSKNGRASALDIQIAKNKNQDILSQITDPALRSALLNAKTPEEQALAVYNAGQAGDKQNRTNTLNEDIVKFGDTFNGGATGVGGGFGDFIDGNASLSGFFKKFSRTAFGKNNDPLSDAEKAGIDKLAQEISNQDSLTADQTQKLTAYTEPQDQKELQDRIAYYSAQKGSISKAAADLANKDTELGGTQRLFSLGAAQGISRNLLQDTSTFNTAQNQIDLNSGLLNNSKDFTNNKEFLDTSFNLQSKSLENSTGLENSKAFDDLATEVTKALGGAGAYTGSEKDKAVYQDILKGIQEQSLFGPDVNTKLKSTIDNVQNVDVRTKLQEELAKANGTLANIGEKFNAANQKLADNNRIQLDLLRIEQTKASFGGIGTLTNPGSFVSNISSPIGLGLASNIEAQADSSNLNTRARREAFGSGPGADLAFKQSEQERLSSNVSANFSSREAIKSLFPDIDSDSLDSVFGNTKKNAGGIRLNQISDLVSQTLGNLTTFKDRSPAAFGRLSRQGASSIQNLGGLDSIISQVENLPVLNNQSKAEQENVAKQLKLINKGIGYGGDKSYLNSSSVARDRFALPLGHTFNKQAYDDAFSPIIPFRPDNGHIRIPQGPYYSDSSHASVSDRFKNIPGLNSSPTDFHLRVIPKQVDLNHVPGADDGSSNILATAGAQVGLAAGDQHVAPSIKDSLSSITTLTIDKDLYATAKSIILNGDIANKTIDRISLENLKGTDSDALSKLNSVVNNAQPQIDDLQGRRDLFKKNGLDAVTTPLDKQFSDTISKDKEQIAAAQKEFLATMTKALTDALNNTKDKNINSEVSVALNVAAEVTNKQLANPNTFKDMQPQLEALIQKILNNLKPDTFPAPPPRISTGDNTSGDSSAPDDSGTPHG